MVLVSDYISTFALYLYKENSFTLQFYHHQTVIGHTAGDFLTYFTADLTTSQLITPDTTRGNTGSAGQWIFELANGNRMGQSERKCHEWINDQVGLGGWTSDMPHCPCTALQARNDWKFNIVEGSSDSDCFILVPSLSEHGLKCCYNSTDGSLLIGSQGDGRYHYYHSLFHPNQHKASDVDPYRYCCLETQNCEQFYKYRPSPDCSSYLAPQTGEQSMLTIVGY